MRVLLDTHIFIWYAKEQDKLSNDVLSILSDYENKVYVSSETLKELVVLWNKKEHIRKWWKTSLALVRSVEDVIAELLVNTPSHFRVQECRR